jgi:signal peptidase I
MADELVPSRSQPLPTNVTPALPDGVAAAGRPAIKPTADGSKGKPTRDADQEAPPLYVPWSSWLLNLGAQFAFAVLLAVFLFLVLLLVLGFNDPSTAGGTSVIVAVLITLFVRHYIHWPLPKEAFAREPRLPPNIRPSDSSGREIVETVVFVVVLVLLLKTFAAEAFVIPTGSMAETLLGYNKKVTCPSCGYTFPVNCSNEVDPQDDSRPRITNGCTCPNCRRVIRLVDERRDGRKPRSGVFQQDGEYVEILDPGSSSGDRVLVGKFFDATTRMKQLVGSSDQNPARLDVVVFKYPEGPQKNHIAMNYIKRLIGLPGETIAIWGGDLYVLSAERAAELGLTYDDGMIPEDKRVEKRGNQIIKHTEKDRWKPQYMHANDKWARDLFEKGGAFEILRKSPEVMLAIKRLVYDNDYQASDLTGRQWQRWLPDAEAWETEDEGKAFRHGTRAGDDGEHWLRYRHLLRRHHGRPTLITDFMGYNSTESLEWRPDSGKWEGGGDSNGNNWVGDLILECEVKIDKPEGELVLELVRGSDRFQARWDLASEDGVCTLTRINAGIKETLEQKPTRLRKGTYRLRFANVDRRLTVWVDNRLPFGDGVNYDPPLELGPTVVDLQPASIGVKGGALTVHKLKLWRDTYHAVYPNKVVTGGPNSGGDVTIKELELEGPTKDPMTGKESFPDSWKTLKNPPLLTLYVQPGHYLCLGDNSPQSSDSRSWGLVPERLLLGRALLVYWPPKRGGRIR